MENFRKCEKCGSLLKFDDEVAWCNTCHHYINYDSTIDTGLDEAQASVVRDIENRIQSITGDLYEAKHRIDSLCNHISSMKFDSTRWNRALVELNAVTSQYNYALLETERLKGLALTASETLD